MKNKTLNQGWIKKTGLIVAFLFTLVHSKAQDIDSLLLAYLNAKHDSAKCNTLIFWAEVVGSENPDTAIKLLETSSVIAKKAMTRYSKNDNLYKIFVNRLARSYNDMGVYYFNQNNIKLTEEYLTKSTKLLQTIDEKEALGDTYSNLGGLQFSKGNTSVAIENSIKGLKIREELKDTAAIISSLNNIGYFYYVSGNIREGINYYSRCIKISEASGSIRGIAMSLLNLAPILYKQNEKKVALNYFHRSLKLLEELKDYKWMAYVLSNIGNIHKNQGDSIEAMSFYNRAVEAGKKVNAKSTLAISYYNIGNFYSATNKTDSALSYYAKAEEISKELGDKNILSAIFISISKVRLKQGNVNESLEFGNKSMTLARESGNPEYIANSAENLKSIYSKKGDFRHALEAFELYLQMRDSVQNDETRKATVKNQLQYEYDKKEAVLKKQRENDHLLAQERDRRQKIVIWSVIGGFVLTAFFLIFVFSRLRITRKQKLLIEKQKEEVERQKAIIDKKNVENELLLGEIHHRVKNNLQVISSLLSLQERSMESGSAKSAIHEGKERVRSMELVHKMLYQGNSFSGIEMSDYVNKLSMGLMESFGLNKNEVELNAKFEPITLDVDTAVPLGLILNELIVNSLKHAKSATEKLILKIEIHENKTQQLQITIADNGSGKVSEIENSNSFGLKIIRALVRQLDGVLEVKEKAGISYSISLKNYKLIT